MKKLFSFVMALIMVTSLVAAPKVAMLNKPVKKARTELTLPAVKKQQVNDVANSRVARKAAIKKMAMATTVTFEPADFEGQGTEGTGSAVSATKSGVTISSDKGFGHNNYTTGLPDQFRVYKDGTLTIAASATITKIEFTFEDDKNGGLSTSYTPNSTSWSETLSVQARISSIVVTLGGEVPPTPPTPDESIYTTINHPTVLDSIADFDWIYVSGENEDYALSIQVNTSHKYGEFTDDDIEYEYTQMIDWAAYDLVDIESIPSVVIAQVEDTLRFTVTVKATDGQVYVVTMNDFVTPPTGEETYVDIVLPEVYDATETEGWFQVLGYDVTGEYYASLCVNTNNMFGSFADADMDWEYTGIYLGETTIQLIESSISVTVFSVADTVVYRAEALDVDGMKWIITMKDFTPTPTEVIDLVTVEADGEYYAEDGDYYATGVTAAGDQIAFDIYMDELASGTFTIGDVETYNSGIVLADGTFVEFYSADITLTVDGGNVLIEAVIIGRDVKQYNVTMEIASGYTPPTPVGDEITVAQAEEIAGALAEGATTTETYTINGYVGTLYDEGDFWLVSEAGGRSDLKVYRPTVDRALTKGDQVQVVGQLQKYVSKSGNVTLEVVNATVTHVGGDVPPTPPTPVGDEITVAQAEEIAGALAEGATTTETYTIVCYAGTTYSYSEQFQNQDFWLVDTNGDKSQTLEAYRSKVDKVVAEGDYISITGQLQKYKAKSGKIILEVVNGTTKHLSATALLKIMQNAKVKKMLKQGKVIILRDNQIFDMSGMQIK